MLGGKYINEVAGYDILRIGLMCLSCRVLTLPNKSSKEELSSVFNILQPCRVE